MQDDMTDEQNRQPTDTVSCVAVSRSMSPPVQAERGGFEPPVSLPTPVFKTGGLPTQQLRLSKIRENAIRWLGRGLGSQMILIETD